MKCKSLEEFNVRWLTGTLAIITPLAGCLLLLVIVAGLGVVLGKVFGPFFAF